MSGAKKVQIEFSEKAYGDLTALAEATDTSKSEAIRRGLRLLKIVDAEMKAGRRIIIEDDDSRREIVTL